MFIKEKIEACHQCHGARVVGDGETVEAVTCSRCKGSGEHDGAEDGLTEWDERWA